MTQTNFIQSFIVVLFPHVPSRHPKIKVSIPLMRLDVILMACDLLVYVHFLFAVLSFSFFPFYFHFTTTTDDKGFDSTNEIRCCFDVWSFILPSIFCTPFLFIFLFPIHSLIHCISVCSSVAEAKDRRSDSI